MIFNAISDAQRHTLNLGLGVLIEMSIFHLKINNF